ncbi:MAG TPA: tRNA(Ile)(2)-agmatinylcytidine synthase [Candidatus Bathyarchaeia archaeon]|nr:tRNA(Ile)(2)-agmatinylcytidine synthase [Candidatus Bathyarchaeia archaeon]
MKEILHIGIDDTDSRKGSCTTHLATVIVTKIFDLVAFLDFPNLIRLNPNIPYKTRGNGAVAIRVKGEASDLEQCREITIKTIEELAQFGEEDTNPGIVFIQGSVPTKIKDFSNRAMWDVITIAEADKFNSSPKIDLIKYGNGRGIIGGLGAIGNQLENDFTYEHLSYRHPLKYGSNRLIERESILVADKATPLTFNNVDYEYNSIMILPRGADPVFAGIRGETVEEVCKAWSLLRPLEDIIMKMVYRTNQHTNQHFVKEFTIKELKPHLSAYLDGEIIKTPYYISGSHLIFRLKDETGEIDCAAYEPTKRFRGQLKNLIIGDKLTVFGGIRPAEETHPMTINIERVKIESLEEKYSTSNPLCEKCGARLKSAGKEKGYKCFKCSAVFKDAKPIKISLQRKIALGEYLPPIIAHRHLTKPESRKDRNNTGQFLLPKDMTKYLNELISYNKKYMS